MPDGVQRQSGSVGKDGGTVFGLLERLLLGSRSSIKVVASARGRVTGHHRQLGMSMPDSMQLQSGSVGEGGGTVFSLLERLLLGSRSSIKVVASTGGRIAGSNRELRMEIIPSNPPEGIEIGHDGGLLLGVLDAETRRSRGAIVVAPGAGGGVGRDDRILGVGVGVRQTAKRGGVGQDMKLLVGLLQAETGRGRGAIVVASVAVAPGIGRKDRLLGVEEGIGHETEALRIGENLAHHFLCTRYVAKGMSYKVECGEMRACVNVFMRRYTSVTYESISMRKVQRQREDAKRSLPSHSISSSSSSVSYSSMSTSTTSTQSSVIAVLVF